MARREKHRDDRDYDTTQLHAAGHGRALARDYSAHFFRWSFARRFITEKDDVLEVGCGQDRPLASILTAGASPHVNRYVGVDLNPLKTSESQRLTFLGEFNFVERHKELLRGEHKEGFDVAVCLEVIEHMLPAHGTKLLKGLLTCLKPGGTLLLSTPCYDRVHHSANHIHEYEVPELQKAIEKAGFTVKRRFGTFMNLKEIGRAAPSVQVSPTEKDLNAEEVKKRDKELSFAVLRLADQLSNYFDADAISCIFAPLFPDRARNNLWLCQKPGGKPKPTGRSVPGQAPVVAARVSRSSLPGRETAASEFKRLILEDKLADTEIFKAVQKKFGLDDKKRGYVSYYRSELRKNGLSPPPKKQ